MQIQIRDAKDGHWYRRYVNNIFDAEVNASGGGYTLIHTPRNEKIFSTEPDGQKKQELLKRLRNVKVGMRLGVSRENAIEIIWGANNKDYKVLLGGEY
jgi:hypothetical protein